MARESALDVAFAAAADVVVELDTVVEPVAIEFEMFADYRMGEVMTEFAAAAVVVVAEMMVS